jgi:hypothetical protein
MQVSSPDPLRHVFELPLRARLYPIGFPLELETNDERILAAARESWENVPQRFPTRPIQVRIGVLEGPGCEVPQRPEFRAQRHLVSIVSDASNFAVCDLNAAFAFGWLTAGAAEAAAWTRHYFLDAIAYCILTQLYVTGVHAACIAKAGRGILLCGPSGIGKSVLALACARAGWTFVTDDVAYLVRESHDRKVIGKPDRMKFLPSAAALFPELGGIEIGADPAGEPLIEVRTRDLGLATASECTIDAIVSLRRPGGQNPRVRCTPRHDTLARLFAELPRFEDQVHEAHRVSLRRLLEAQTLELEYTNLDDAVRALNEFTEADQWC